MMFKTYGRHRKTTSWFPLIPSGQILPPLPPPEKVYHDRSSKCLGCPYPAHGLMCHDNRSDGSCLRTDMQELEEKHRQEYLSRRQETTAAPTETLVVLGMAFAAENR